MRWIYLGEFWRCNTSCIHKPSQPKQSFFLFPLRCSYVQPTMSSCKRKQILSGLHPCPVYYHQIPNHRHITAQSFNDKEEVEKPVHWSWGTCQNFLNFFNLMSAKISTIRKGINLKTRKRAEYNVKWDITSIWVFLRQKARSTLYSEYLNVILMAFWVKLLKSLLKELRCPC